MSVSTYGTPARAAIAREHRRRHDGRGVRAWHAAAQQRVGEQHAHLVAAQHPPQPVRVGHRDGAPVGVRVVGDDDVRAPLPRQFQRKVQRARLLRIGERHGREVGVGLLLLRHRGDVGEPGAVQHRVHDLAADAVQRRVHDAQVARAVGRGAGERRHRRDVGLGQLGAEVPHGRRVQRHGARRGDVADRGLDRGVGRRHDLHAGGVVDLVPVVLGRVVRRGDHHAGHRAQVPHRERQHRRRQRRRQHRGLEAGGGEHRGRVVRELLRAVPRVVADDDARARRVPGGAQVRGQPGGGAAHDGAVHAVRAGAQRPAQARRCRRSTARRTAPRVRGRRRRRATPAARVRRRRRRRRRSRRARRSRRVTSPPRHHRVATSSMPKPGEVKPPPTNPSDGSGAAASSAVGVGLGVVARLVAERPPGGQVPGAAGVGRDAPHDREAERRRAQAGVDEPRAVGGREPRRQRAHVARAVGERADAQARDLPCRSGRRSSGPAPRRTPC